MPKILIAVTTCHAFRDRGDAVRQTWGAEVVGAADIESFYAGGKQLYSTVEALDSRARCVSIAPFDRPVVPDV